MSTVSIQVPETDETAVRVIPVGRLVGVIEIAKILSESGRLADRYPNGVTDRIVSSWAQPDRRQTNGFPEPVVNHLRGTRLWDAADFANYSGPPGRWSRNPWADVDG